jgi:L-asparaginase II
LPTVFAQGHFPFDTKHNNAKQARHESVNWRNFAVNRGNLMSGPEILAEVWRDPFLESVHRGHAVICDATGAIVEAWGNPDQIVLPRSSGKMLQALPLIESGAAAAHGLTPAHLALACASHSGALIHTDPVRAWLEDLGLGDDNLRCGSHLPEDEAALHDLIRRDMTPCQVHNNCSGKHAGFLTLAQHLGAGPEYIEADHPVQVAVLDAVERMTGETSPGFAIDGCSAPNYATSLQGMARAMARFAAAPAESAAGQLVAAMHGHPDLVAGEGRACTDLMRACGEPVAVKTGAEAFYVAILPVRKLGIALKIEDGTTRAAECAIAALLVRLGALQADHPLALKYTNRPVPNCRDIVTGHVRAAPALI